MGGCLRGTFLIAGLLTVCLANARAPEVGANDNRKPAGHLANGVLSIGIEVGEGNWWPERAMPPNPVLAFRETGGALTTPGPLIRVREGTRVEIAWHNRTDADIYVHGLAAPAGATPLRIAAHGTAATHVTATNAGTFYYWGTLDPATKFSMDRDGELVGAFIVDPPDGAGNDRIFVIEQLGADFDGIKVGSGYGAWTINGRSWPDTERLTYAVGEKVEWRFINASNDPHPLHLHGTYFQVTRAGDATRDEAIPGDRRQKVVTEAIASGSTMTIEWSPERPGNWLFHCHLQFHVIPEQRLHEPYWYRDYAQLEHDHHMSGLVLGIHAVAAGETTAADETVVPRRMTLHVAERAGVVYEGEGLKRPGLGYALEDGPVSGPGPVLALERGKPVEITVVNQMTRSTAVHWHGIELESYYDGVPHFGGDALHMTPEIAPRGSFTARFTPPRAGTFIYHTHFNDYVQIASGLYGALIVTEPGQAFSPDTDHLFVIGQHGFDEPKDPLLLNGSATPALATWHAGPHRIRMIGMTPNVRSRVRLTKEGAPVAWTPRARDGADLPDALRKPVPAEVELYPGQTYDYDIVAEPGELRLEGRVDGGARQSVAARVLVER